MTTLYLLRHAEARGNVDRVFQGHFNSELTEKGEKQLLLLKEKFKNIDYDVIYSSDLNRAYKTALAVNHKNLDINISKNLREIDGGTWENMSYTDIIEKFPDEYNTWGKDMTLLQMPNGESFSEFSDRIITEIDNIVRNNKDKTIVITSHGTVLKAYLCYAKYCDFKNIMDVKWADNTSISKIEFDDNYNKSVVFEGDNTHLVDSMSTLKFQHWYKKPNETKKVVTVTLNTCIDKNIFVENVVRAGLNRVKKVTKNYAGKGISVSNALSSLYINSTATGFLASNNLNQFNDSFKKNDIKNEFIIVDGDARENIKILDLATNEQTEFNENGIFINDECKALLLDKIRALCDKNTYVVISGSNPQNYTFSDYTLLVDEILKTGADLIIDSENERLELAIEKKAFLIKPNLFELETLLNVKLNDNLEKIKEAANSIIQKGVKYIIITMGDAGAVLSNDKNCYYIKAPTLNIKGLSGAGDSALAGFLAGQVKDMDFEESALLSIATSSAAVIAEGTNPPILLEIEKFLEVLKLEKI